MPSITISRTVAVDGVVVTETASAPIADDLTLDDETESSRRYSIAVALFLSLPSLKSQSIPPPCQPPLNSLN